MSRLRRFLRWTLVRVLPPGPARDALPGDLEELHAERRGRDGRLRADLWYLRQVAGAGVRYAPARLAGLAAGLGRGGRADALGRDLRFAVRSLARDPGFTAVAVLTLAIGIGANTAIFSVVNAVLLRPLPYPDAERVVTVWNTISTSPQAALSEPELVDYGREIRSFDRLAAYRTTEANLTGGGEPERVAAGRATADLFDVLGVEPMLGRAFTVEEDRPGRDDVVLLGHGLWERRFGGDPSLVGTAVQVDGRSRTVVGVMPPDFRLPSDFGVERPSELWVPLALDPADPASRGRHNLQGLARLAPGATPAQADAELEVVARRWIDEGVVDDAAFSTYTVPVRDEIVGEVRPALLVLFAAVALVLLIACANVANLLLARIDERGKELAVRTALGAGRGAIARQLFTESLVLAALGGAAGLLLAFIGLHGIVDLAATRVPGLDGVSLDPAVLAFTAAITLGVGMAFGSLPALRSARHAPIPALKEGGRTATGGRSRQRVRRGLVVAEVALSVMLVIGAGLLTRSFLEMRGVELGFDPARVLTLRLTLPGAEYPETERIVGFYREMRERLESVPGVTSAGATALLPLDQQTGDWGIDIEGRVRGPENRFHGYLQIVTPGYFEAMGIPVVRGRAPEPSDDGDAPPAVVINERMAERYWPGESAIGRRIRIRMENEGPWFTVVGIVGDIRHNAIVEEPRHEMYYPHAQLPLALGGTTAAMNVVVRTVSDPAAMATPVREAIRSLDPALPVARLRSMEKVVGSALAEARFTLVLLGSLAGLALLLGAVGLYAVTTYSVARRTREIGIRMTLGAARTGVVRMVVLQAVASVGAGVVLGLLGAFGASRVLSGMLYGVSTTDPVTFVAVPLVLTLVALLAAWVPARRASRVDPLIALRQE